MWIETYSGKRFDIEKPQPEMIEIKDIAHALSLICRFGAHTRVFYSVAQHSVLASYLVPKEHAFEALMHDASEAFLQDMPSPIKGLLPDYKKLETVICEAIFDKYHLKFPLNPAIKEIDTRLLITEAREFMHCNNDWVEEIQEDYLPIKLDPWSPEEAEKRFLKRFKILKYRIKETISTVTIEDEID